MKKKGKKVRKKAWKKPKINKKTGYLITTGCTFSDDICGETGAIHLS